MQWGTEFELVPKLDVLPTWTYAALCNMLNTVEHVRYIALRGFPHIRVGFVRPVCVTSLSAKFHCKLSSDPLAVMWVRIPRARRKAFVRQLANFFRSRGLGYYRVCQRYGRLSVLVPYSTARQLIGPYAQGNMGWKQVGTLVFRWACTQPEVTLE
jgi:hypothetical protein